METQRHEPLIINGQEFEIIKPTRLLNGMVLKSGDTFARVGDKQPTIEEQVHTISLYNRGFPVPQVLASGELDDNKWYFTETSLGEDTFHKQFSEDYQLLGQVSEKKFINYLGVITDYAKAQSNIKNKTTINPQEFINTLLPRERVLRNYCFFGHDEQAYLESLNIAANKLSSAAMGIIQHDFNPFNVLDGGVIDFELVGYGPVGFDTLMSARWSSGWFTDYPSRYPVVYKLSSEQIMASDQLVDDTALKNGLPIPTQFLQEFLLLKSAWAVSDLSAPSFEWPQDKLAFRNYRANVLNLAVKRYLKEEEIDFTLFSKVSGGELNQE